jgi:hypothetical protein
MCGVGNTSQPQQLRERPELAAQVGENDPFLGYGSIITFLIAVHVVAFLFWLFMLARGSRPAKKVATD